MMYHTYLQCIIKRLEFYRPIKLFYLKLMKSNMIIHNSDCTLIFEMSMYFYLQCDAQRAKEVLGHILHSYCRRKLYSTRHHRNICN